MISMSIFHIQCPVVALKTCLRSGSASVGRLSAGIADLAYRLYFADGRHQTAFSSEFYADWGRQLVQDGLQQVLVSDISHENSFPRSFRCYYSNYQTDWDYNEVRQLEDDSMPGIKYLWEYSERRLPDDTPLLETIQSPAIPFAKAIDINIDLTEKYCSDKRTRGYMDREVIMRPLEEIKAVLSGNRQKRSSNTPHGLLARSHLRFDSPTIENLYAAAELAGWFLNMHAPQNENIPYDFRKICSDVHSELHLQIDRVGLYALNLMP
jgi:hypothetical protein